MKKLIAVVALLALAGCTGQSALSNIKNEQVVGTVVQEYEDPSPSKWGCGGTNWNTIVQFDNSRVAKLCGRWGGVGAKVGGCWETGNLDGMHDGFRLVCRNK